MEVAKPVSINTEKPIVIAKKSEKPTLFWCTFPLLLGIGIIGISSLLILGYKWGLPLSFGEGIRTAYCIFDILLVCICFVMSLSAIGYSLLQYYRYFSAKNTHITTQNT